MNYELALKLSNFIDARIADVEDNDGNMEQCLVIPMEKNGLFETKLKNVFCHIFVNEKFFDSNDDNTHFLRLKTNDNHRAKLDSLGYDAPYLGVMKPSKFKPLQQHKYSFNQKVKNIEN